LILPIPPNDFWWHMAAGREIVAEHAIPQVDSYSYTQAGTPFYDQPWLAQVALYALYELGGVQLVLLVSVLAILFAYGLVLRLALIWATVLGEAAQTLFRRLRRSDPSASGNPGEEGCAGRLWRLTRWGAVTGLAVLLNPGGPGIFEYVRNAVSQSAVVALG